MRTKVAGLVLAAAGFAAMAGCGSLPPAAGADTGLPVVATTTQVADFLRNVGGDKVSVTQILKPGVDPHDYEPTPADITAIGRAKLVARNGVHLDSWLDPTITAAGFAGQLVDASTGVAVRAGEDQEGDPHVWQNPLNVKIMAADIETGLAAVDPDNAAYYQQNLAIYQAKLDKLDADIQAKLATIPADQRKLVTNHDAFRYYVDRYHLEFVGSIIPSFDTSAELSGTDLQDLVAKIRATGVKAIFSESSLPPKTAETIASQAGVKVEAGEDSLFADTLGPAGSAGATYLDALTHNTDVIVKALSG